MKLATSLAIAAIAIAAGSACADNPSQIQQNSTEDSTTSYCPNVSCPDVYDPVTDENGVKYPNKCAMEDAKCKGPRENVLDEYKRVYGKDFSAPRDENESVNSNSNDSDKCDDIICLQIVDMPVCSSDGVWYSNPCEFSIAACKNPAANIVEDATACVEDAQLLIVYVSMLPLLRRARSPSFALCSLKPRSSIYPSNTSRLFSSLSPNWKRATCRSLTSLTPEKHSPELPTLHGKNLLSLVSRARDSHPLDWSEGARVAEETDQWDLMDPHYDLTNGKLTKLFSLFQPNDNGMVSYDGFRRGLQAMGISCENEDEFKAFIGQVDDDKSGGITYEEFLYAIQEIKLAQLFSPDFVNALNREYVKMYGSEVTSPRLGSIEYSPDRIRSAYPIEGVEKFMYSKRPSWASVRWINVEGTDPLMMRRLAVRYRLHPLAVEDTLDADLERPKFEQYDEHSSLVLQTVHARDLSKALEYQSMYRASLYVRDNSVSPFESMSKSELERRIDDLGMGRIMAPPEQLSLYIMENVVISVQESPSTLWPTLKQRLHTSYSKVRQSGTAFLVYSIVDVCVDELSPIAHTYGAKVAMLSRLFRHDPRNFDVDRLAKCSKEIKGLKLLCKPLREMTTQLMESNEFEGETLRYFRDVQDHVTVIDETCDRLLDRCRSLVDDFHNARHAQQSEVSYTLTLVATVFLPAQFLTGLYGMNFVNMPELQYEHGYLIWWGITSTIASGTITYFKFYKKWL